MLFDQTSLPVVVRTSCLGDRTLLAHDNFADLHVTESSNCRHDIVVYPKLVSIGMLSLHDLGNATPFRERREWLWQSTINLSLTTALASISIESLQIASNIADAVASSTAFTPDAQRWQPIPTCTKPVASFCFAAALVLIGVRRPRTFCSRGLVKLHAICKPGAFGSSLEPVSCPKLDLIWRADHILSDEAGHPACPTTVQLC